LNKASAECAKATHRRSVSFMIWCSWKYLQSFFDNAVNCRKLWLASTLRQMRTRSGLRAFALPPRGARAESYGPSSGPLPELIVC
jgi:uncharacterized protein YcsI (UPF0317 family)